jgi:hypothetical protein
MAASLSASVRNRRKGSENRTDRERQKSTRTEPIGSSTVNDGKGAFSGRLTSHQSYFFCSDLGQKLGMKPVIAF